MAEVTQEVIETYNAIAAEYDRMFGDVPSDYPYLDDFCTLLPQNSRVLDVGCGTAALTRYFVKHGFATEGLDLSDSMLEIARKRLPSITFHKRDMQNLGSLGRNYDGICFSYSLFHLPKSAILKALTGAYQILAPSGAILVILQEGEGERWVEEPLDRSRRMFLSLHSEEEGRRLLEQIGFALTKVRYKDVAAEGELPFRKMFLTATKRARQRHVPGTTPW